MTEEMTFDKEAELLDNTAIHFIINCYLKNVFPKQKDFILDIRKLTEIYAPAKLDKILKEEGWKRLDFETNGWQQDTWYYYAHPDYDFQLIMEYSGFYGDLKLYREDIDD